MRRFLIPALVVFALAAATGGLIAAGGGGGSGGNASSAQYKPPCKKGHVRRHGKCVKKHHGHGHGVKGVTASGCNGSDGFNFHSTEQNGSSSSSSSNRVDQNTHCGG